MCQLAREDSDKCVLIRVTSGAIIEVRGVWKVITAVTVLEVMWVWAVLSWTTISYRATTSLLIRSSSATLSCPTPSSLHLSWAIIFSATTSYPPPSSPHLFSPPPS